MGHEAGARGRKEGVAHAEEQGGRQEGGGNAEAARCGQEGGRDPHDLTGPLASRRPGNHSNSGADTQTRTGDLLIPNVMAPPRAPHTPAR